MKIIFSILILHFKGGNESEVQHHDVSMFDISNTKLFCENILSSEYHSASIEPILNMDLLTLDNTTSPDHNQLTQSSPHVQLDSSVVTLDPFPIDTGIDEVDLVFYSEIDYDLNEINHCLHDTTTTPNTESTNVQYNLPPRSNHGKPLISYLGHMHHLYLNYKQFLFIVMYRKLWQILKGPKQWLKR